MDIKANKERKFVKNLKNVYTQIEIQLSTFVWYVVVKFQTKKSHSYYILLDVALTHMARCEIFSTYGTKHNELSYRRGLFRYRIFRSSGRGEQMRDVTARYWIIVSCQKGKNSKLRCSSRK